MEAPVEGRVSQSCLALAKLAKTEPADWAYRVTPQSLLWQLITGLLEAFVGVGDAPDWR